MMQSRDDHMVTMFFPSTYETNKSSQDVVSIHSDEYVHDNDRALEIVWIENALFDRIDVSLLDQSVRFR
jgi:hypothetical protein